MKKVFFILLGTIFALNLYALQESDILPTMQEKVQTATKILSQKNEPLEKKAQEIFNQLENMFDINLMGRISLGKYWNSLSKEQQDQYNKTFEKYMKKYYTDKLKLYNNEKITITEAQKIKDNRIFVYSEIQGEKEVYKIIYKFYKDQNNSWFIYDVDIIGVSLIKTTKAQFEDIMANNSFEDLLKKLQN